MMLSSVKPRAAPAVGCSRRAVAVKATKYDEELIKTAVRTLPPASHGFETLYQLAADALCLPPHADLALPWARLALISVTITLISHNPIHLFDLYL
jgi:hypothetical protein